MTHEQFMTIYGLIMEARMKAAGDRAVAQSDWERQWANKLMAAAHAAQPALSAAWMASAILRGQAPCPECGAYLGTDDEKKEAA